MRTSTRYHRCSSLPSYGSPQWPPRGSPHSSPPCTHTHPFPPPPPRLCHSPDRQRAPATRVRRHCLVFSPRSAPPVFPPFLFFFNDTATPEIYTLSLHDALPICHRLVPRRRGDRRRHHCRIHRQRRCRACHRSRRVRHHHSERRPAIRGRRHCRRIARRSGPREVRPVLLPLVTERRRSRRHHRERRRLPRPHRLVRWLPRDRPRYPPP